MIHGVHRIGIQNAVEPIGIGYIVIPHQTNRETYVTDAMRRERVTIMPDEGSTYIPECNITKSALNEIEFPPNDNELGSSVVFITHPFHNVPVVIGVINKLDNSSLMDELTFLFQRQSANMSNVTVRGQAREAYLSMSATNEDGSAYIVLKSTGNSDSNVAVESSGDVRLLGDQNIIIESGQTLRLTMNVDGDTDNRTTIEFNADQITLNKTNGGVENEVVITDSEININPESRLSIKSGSEPLVKGAELTTQLNQNNLYLTTLVAQVAAAITASGAPTGSAASAAFLQAMNAIMPGNYTNINSDISFTD